MEVETDVATKPITHGPGAYAAGRGRALVALLERPEVRPVRRGLTRFLQRRMVGTVMS